MAEVPLYLTIRRQHQTYCLLASPTDTVASLQDQISAATQGEYQPSQMRLLCEDKDSGMTVLPPEDTLEKHASIQNESNLYVVFQIADDEWEEVKVESLEDPTSSGADN
eukprot:Nitzschia sp. Nitz4//scaffold16_size188269//3082//3560//NITZ4_001760-RA/size188269-snap-gene-0.133-mRNA-1//-1//CDS//3329538422//9041//frame0